MTYERVVVHYCAVAVMALAMAWVVLDDEGGRGGSGSNPSLSPSVSSTTPLWRLRETDGPDVRPAATSPRPSAQPLPLTIEAPAPTDDPILVPASLEALLRAYGATDPAEMLAVAHCESRYDPGAVNRESGARGTWQFMPRTWAYLARVLGLDAWPEGAHDVEQSTRAAVWLWTTEGPQHWEACR